jgi:hypothetical protein
MLYPPGATTPPAVTPDEVDRLRTDLRALYVAAHHGPWKASVPAGAWGQVHLVAGDGRVLAMPNRLVDAQLMAAARNALPHLFREIDRVRTELLGRMPAIPVLGEIGDGGRVAWRGEPPGRCEEAASA